MKKLLIATAALAALTAGANAQTVRIGTEGAYAPWNYINEDGKVDGFDIAVGNKICEMENLDCEWVVNEWDTIIPNLLAGNYDAIMAAMTITDERMQTIGFSDDYYPPDPSLFAVPSGSDLDPGAMSGARIGVQGATIQADYANANLADGNTIVAYETADQAVADLSAGNVDIVLADGPYIQPIVDASGGALEVAGDGVSIGGGIGTGMRKEDSDLKAKWDDAISKMKADGSLNDLINEWFDSPTTF